MLSNDSTNTRELTAACPGARKERGCLSGSVDIRMEGNGSMVLPAFGQGYGVRQQKGPR